MVTRREAEPAPTPLQLASAGPADAPAIARVFMDARAQMVYLPVSRHSARETAAFFGRLIEDPDRLVLAARHADGAIAAFGVFGEGRLDHLYVRPADQRRGIGSALIEAAQARFERLEGWVFERNTEALDLYRQHGFVAVERTDGSGNEEHEPDVRIAWSRAGSGG